MSICKVLQLGDPRLRQVSDPVEDPGAPEIERLITDLADTLAHWRETTTYGRAISAPQLGVRARVVYVEIDRPWPLVNPEIVERGPEDLVVWDACLSFLTIFFQVRRSRWIRVTYQDPNGERQEVRAEGDLSELLQHEIDHLDGVLAIDRMTDVKTLCTREEFELRHRADSPYSTPAPKA